MTPKQKEVHEFIVKYVKKHLYAPTIREICEGVGIASTSRVHAYLRILEAKGYIELKEHESRAIKIKGYRLVKNDIVNTNKMARTEDDARW